MKKLSTLVLLAVSFMVLTPADGGHEVPVYPSYYPQEIRIETVDLASAAGLLRKGAIHAYVGDGLVFGEKTPDNVSYVESLGSYLVLTVNRASPVLDDREARCSAVRPTVRALAGATEGFIFHPYPITPYHMDYLHHFDLAEASKNLYLSDAGGHPSSASPVLKVRAKGMLAETLVRPRRLEGETEWDATVEEINAGDLVASHTVVVNGWLGPPWVKEGWFHALLLLAETVSDATARETVELISGRLRRGEYERPEEKLNLERNLVRLLTGGCERVVVGYTLKRWYFNSEYSGGVENIAYDSHTGFNSPMFLRTVKLKDFPWNGWLRLGISSKPFTAWNPVGGFTDPASRLIWFAVGDPALFPDPYNAGWVLNRISDVQSTLKD
ncbi:MAG: hypothetical protein ACE5JD_16785 [Candidatus Methylomirabilia bacterium]